MGTSPYFRSISSLAALRKSSFAEKRVVMASCELTGRLVGVFGGFGDVEVIVAQTVIFHNDICIDI